MSKSRRLAVASAFVLVPLLAGCGGSTVSDVKAAASSLASVAQSAASQAASAASQIASAAASSSPSDSSGSGGDSSAPADSGSPAATAGSLCAAVAELKKMPDQPKASDVATLKQTAADIRASAPAEVAQGAASYATILESLAASLEAGSNGKDIGMAQAIAKGMGKDPAQITAFILYVTKTCK
jgi:hypothetical protein